MEIAARTDGAPRIHSLDGPVGFPIGLRLFPRRFHGHMATHLVAVASRTDRENGPVLLVDAGLSRAELERPRRLGGLARVLRFRADPSRSAVSLLAACGISPERVTDIVLTHLDLDHAGGLGDLPAARVHVHPVEREAAHARRTLGERVRYRPAQFCAATFVEIPESETELAPGIPALPLDLPADHFGRVALVPLFGHTRGHCGVLLRDADPPLLHVGDAYYDHSERTLPPSVAFSLFRRSVHVDARAAARSLARLDAIEAGIPGLRIVSTHDPTELPGHALGEPPATPDA